MVQIIENWSDIRGAILVVGPSVIAGFSSIRLRVDEINSVNGFANLLKDYKEKEIDLLIRDEFVKAKDIKAGDNLRCRVRRARPDRMFVNDEYLEKL